nr:uncharacterized mitochondrial protein AtMg00810-like [Tanacetum cinerariifolium]
MMIALNAKNKMKIINGEFAEPEVNLRNRALWERTNDMIISWILNTISERISNSLSFVNYASHLWNELQEHYSQLDGHIIYQLTHDLVQLKQSNTAIETYYHKLKGQILLMNPMPTVAKAYSMIRQEEKQREGFVSKISVATALSAHSNNYRNSYNNNARGGRNYNQGESSVRGTSNSDYQMRRGVFRKGIICGNCSKEGHTREECYKLAGYHVGHPLHGKYKPPNTPKFTAHDNSVYRSVKMTVAQGNTESSSSISHDNDSAMSARMDQLQNQLNQMMLMMQNNKDMAGTQPFNVAGTPKHVATFTTMAYRFIASHISARKYKMIASILINQRFLWVVDSGATDHVCIALSSIHNIQICTQPIYVTLPNGQHTKVTKIGSIHINSAITLHDVLYIPAFSYNLLSVSKLSTHLTLSILFTPFSCYFQDHHKRIAHGSLYNGLYIIKQEPTAQPYTIISITNNNVALWHSRLGHPSLKVLQQIKSLSTSNTCTFHDCNICPLAKQNALPFPISESHSNALFDLIHVDIWRPYKHPTVDQCKYFLTIVDDYSRATWTYLLPSKQHRELQALEANNTWTLTTLPLNKRPIASKWVFKIKCHSNGSIERFKARLIAKGFTQQEGVDYTETFAPVAKMVTVRILLVIVVHHNWNIAQLDINNAFLHRDLSKEELDQAFSIKDLEQLNYYPVIEFLRNSKGITMPERKYALELLQSSKVLDLKPSHIPVDPIAKLNDFNGDPLTDPSTYRAIVGKLLYLTITRPDLSYAAHALSQFSHNPRIPHWKALIKVLRYIKLCPAQGLFIPTNTNFHLKAYCDSDWANCPNTRRSVTGFCIF